MTESEPHDAQENGLEPRRIAGLALVGLGALLLLARLGDDPGWLWIGLVAIGFLVAYVRERRYAFLVLGSMLAGASIGQLLEGNWGWEQAFLISLGVGTAAIDRIEPRSNRWPLIVGLAMIGIGVVSRIVASGVLFSLPAALVLIAVGVALVLRERSGGSGWVEVPPPAAGRAGSRAGDGTPVAVPEKERAGATSSASGAGDAAEASTAGGVGDAATTERGDGAADPKPREPHDPSDGGAVGRRRFVPESERLAALEAWRREVAERTGSAPGAVVPDSTLAHVAAAAPRDREALAQVNGVGPVTLERYGAELLRALERAGSPARSPDDEAH